jgi:REP element-mobilizing transposase RayT
MPRHLRYQSTAWATHLITARCTQGYSLLRPSRAENALIAGCLARALEVSQDEIRLHHYVIMSNHLHLIISSARAASKSRFMCHLSSNLARELCRVHKWSDHVWEGRYHSHEILDDEALIDAYRYLFKNSVKEGLVAHPRDWPGHHGWAQLCAGVQVEGAWVDRTAWYYAQQTQRGRSLRIEDFTRLLEVKLHRPACWADLSDEAYRARCIEWAEEATQEALYERAVALRMMCAMKGEVIEEPPVLGAVAVCEEAVFSSRRSPRRTRPLCRARCPQRFLDYLRGYRAFRDAFLDASSRLRAAVEARVRIPDVIFPVEGVALYVGRIMT